MALIGGTHPDRRKREMTHEKSFDEALMTTIKEVYLLGKEVGEGKTSQIQIDLTQAVINIKQAIKDRRPEGYVLEDDPRDALSEWSKALGVE